MSNSVFSFEPSQSFAKDQADRLRNAAERAASWTVIPRPPSPSSFLDRIRAARIRLRQLEEFLTAPPALFSGNGPHLTAPRAAMHELRLNFGLLRSALAVVSDRPHQLSGLPRVVVPGLQDEPRISTVAIAYLGAVDGAFSAPTFHTFINALQAHEPFTLDELWDLAAFLKFALLESLLDEARALRRNPEALSPQAFSTGIRSLREVGNTDWNFLIEPLIGFDSLLFQDPAGAYKCMDFESRQFYRKRVATIARRSDCTETQVAQTALDLARQGMQRPLNNPRMQRRIAHVGHYLIGKGFSQLAERVGFHPSVSWRVRQFVREYAEDFYIVSIMLCTIFFVAAMVFPVLGRISSLSSLVFAACVLLFPTMQIAVELVNHLITSCFDPDHLPKLDFSRGIPTDCATLVAVPSLLLNEKQVRELVTDLEVRYLANRDPELHFGLLTDLPDAVSKPRENGAHPLVELAIRLIDELNVKYQSQRGGTFLLLHRCQVFNTREGVWMGWERKRGKLLDLNKLLTGEFDAFPIKTGNVETLRRVRYVLTLDSDTQLPRGTAASLVGAIAHPLNQAVVDPHTRIVIEGYGILQPRIGVTVRSTARSRFAAIYSGQSGFDIYTRAISDPYQDLFGEGIFTGKGIYEVAILREVLDQRFPRNALLSHDLIEGAYARAGLVTDIELVDDYPSRYNAYSRRQHRWVRGDWQIAQWMFSRVQDESNRWVPNPISGISRWKIFDNMRRSLLDLFLVLLFVAGWLGLPGGPIYWTVASLVLLFFPVFAQFAFGVGRALASGKKVWLRQELSAFWISFLIAFFHLILLAQQAFLAFDAVFRALIRRFVTGERLLQWETAEQAELLSATPNWIDRYLVITPFLTASLAALVWLLGSGRSAILCAAPILLLWAVAGPATAWLNGSPCERRRLEPIDVSFLTINALRIWRYFNEFGTEDHNYLVPDNVQEEGLREAARISPTNIGMLLNARQAACELGFITTPEFAELTCKSLATIGRLRKFRGHLYNWYDTRSLEPLGSAPNNAPFISTVDSGNFAASLYTLHMGVRDLAKAPLLHSRLFAGLHAHWNLIGNQDTLPAQLAMTKLPAPSAPAAVWIEWLPAAYTALSSAVRSHSSTTVSTWWLAETVRRIKIILALVHDYQPWTLPEYEQLLELPQLTNTKQFIKDSSGSLSVRDSLWFAGELDVHLTSTWPSLSGRPELSDLCERLRAALHVALHNLQALADDLNTIGHEAEQLAAETDFSFLVNPSRQILSIGYDTATNKIHEGCYDLIASEARIATFLAIARGDLPQQSWFKLSRDQSFVYGRLICYSWTGTMFEYLMPALWMRSYPNTLIAQTQDACVHVQKAFAQAGNFPWGISESGHAQKNCGGDYEYHAFGIPRIAISDETNAGPVVSPYSTFLALGVDAIEALRNLRRMTNAGWTGTYGFYEAADYTSCQQKPVLIREWMAHHQGMSLLAIVNLLGDNVIQRWFHENPLVQSAERLLQEVPASRATLEPRLAEPAPTRIGLRT